MIKKKGKLLYQKPKIKVKKITLNMFFMDYPFDNGMLLANCWTYDCSPCGSGCVGDCKC